MTAQPSHLTFPTYPYARSADQSATTPAHHPVVVGAGPVGLAMSLDLGRRGVRVLAPDDNEGIGESARAICFAKPRLEICDRLGLAGPMTEKRVVWTSIYPFQCRRMNQFRHGRVIFAGDSAHQVSPFCARAANSGVQDVDNPGWKRAAVMARQAADRLLDTYDSERGHGADENIANATRATDLITPKTPVSRMLRNAVLGAAPGTVYLIPPISMSPRAGKALRPGPLPTALGR